MILRHSGWRLSRCVWGEGVFPAVLYAAAFHSFYPLTLFDCERGEEVPLAFCTTLGVTLFILEVGAGRKGGGRPLLACQELSHKPLSDLRHSVLSLSIQPPPPPPNTSSYPSLLISTALLCALPHPPLFCCWGNAIWQG